MSLLVSARRCVRCQGNAYYRDLDGPACLMCGEPVERPAPLPLVLSNAALGRTRKGALFCQAGHPFTPENTIIRRNGTRNCKTCHREWARASRRPSVVYKVQR